jgi:hypothetical protein
VEAIFRKAGFHLEMDPLLRMVPPQHVLDSLLPEYRALSKDDLELISAGLYLRKPFERTS